MSSLLELLFKKPLVRWGGCSHFGDHFGISIGWNTVVVVEHHASGYAFRLAGRLSADGD